jgi:hypothetical protein
MLVNNERRPNLTKVQKMKIIVDCTDAKGYDAVRTSAGLHLIAPLHEALRILADCALEHGPDLLMDTFIITTPGGELLLRFYGD